MSHLRKSDGKPHEEGGQISLDDLRGSGAIKQVSDIIIGAERDQQADDNRDVMQLRILKNRFTGETGVAGSLAYNSSTGRIVESQLQQAARPKLVKKRASVSTKPTAQDF